MTPMEPNYQIRLTSIQHKDLLGSTYTKYLNIKNKSKIYKSGILSIVLYSITEWGQTHKNLIKIEQVQNKILRTIFSAEWYILFEEN